MANTFFKIETITVGAGGVASVTFSSIPQTYTDLKLVMSTRTNAAAIYGVGSVRPNGATANRTAKTVEGTGAAVNSYSETDFRFEPNGNTATASVFGSAEAYFPNYTSANFKSASLDTVLENNAASAYAYLKAWLWSDTAAITSLGIFATGLFLEHSSFTLYGIKNS